MSKSKKDLEKDVEFLTKALHNNGKAEAQGKSKKTWAKRDLVDIQAITTPQKDMIHYYLQDCNICAYGSAGTGKTLIALYMALSDIFDPDTPRTNIIIVRSAVPSREMGFLPGTLEEKMMQYEIPYQDLFAFLLSKTKAYDNMKKQKLVRFITTSYIRGITLEDSVVVFDEVQNCTFHEINSVMTRIGEDSRVIVCGDVTQTDLSKKGEVSGMDKLLKISDRMDNFEPIQFRTQDIVRSSFVKSWIIASEESD